MIKIIENIIIWAENEPKIRALILEGSMVSGTETDELSDYDINLFLTDDKKYTESNTWIYTFDDVVMYQKPDFTFGKWYIPSRLVVYKNSPRIDFSFWNVRILKHFVEKRQLPEWYKNGCRILLDKDNIASKLPEPTHDGYSISKPSKDNVLKTIYDFWFEVYCVAKYLKRGSVFYAKMVENSYIKKFLVQMIIWCEVCEKGWGSTHFHTEGKNLEKVINKDLLAQLSECFSGYGQHVILKSLCNMMKLFERLSKKLCDNLEIEYPEDRLVPIKKYVSNILDWRI